MINRRVLRIRNFGQSNDFSFVDRPKNKRPVRCTLGTKLFCYLHMRVKRTRWTRLPTCLGFFSYAKTACRNDITALSPFLSDGDSIPARWHRHSCYFAWAGTIPWHPTDEPLAPILNVEDGYIVTNGMHHVPSSRYKIEGVTSTCKPKK